MNEFLIEFFGTKSLQFHLAGVLFALLGSLLAKYHFYMMNKAENINTDLTIKFSLKYWIRKNWEDVTISVVSSFLFVRFSSIFLEWLNPKMEAGFGFSLPLTDDHIFYYLLVGGLIQLWIHKKYKQRRAVK